MGNGFDPCNHKLTSVAIIAARLIRQAKGLPEEKNITKLFREVAPLLGLQHIVMESNDVSKLPAPYEMKDEKGRFVVPRQDCPKCGKIGMVVLDSLCRNCTEAEGGKYRTVLRCMDNECGYRQVSEKAYVKWLDELVPNWQSGLKQDMGIKISTDGGLV